MPSILLHYRGWGTIVQLGYRKDGERIHTVTAQGRISYSIQWAMEYCGGREHF